MDLGHHRPRRLSAAEEARARFQKRLTIASIVLVAAGLISVIRLLATGKEARSATDT